MAITRRILMMGFPILAILLTSCSATPASTPTPQVETTASAPAMIVAEGRLEPIRFAELALNTSGLVSEVLRKEGDSVQAGEVIARLENAQARSLESAKADALQRINAAYQAVRDAQYNYDIFDIPAEFAKSTPTDAVHVTEERLNRARTAFEPYKFLDERQLQLTDAEKDNPILRSTPKRLKKDLDDAWEEYRRAVKWLDRASVLENARAELAQAQKDYDSLNDPAFKEDTAGVRAALANAEVRAPFSGTLTNLKLKVGEFASTGAPVATVADLSKWVVKTTDLTEIDVVNIQEGESVTLSLDAMPGAELDGRVLSIAQNYSEKQGDIVYEVTILLAEARPAMRWGMTAQVNFPR
ncbi:MAG TPA: efflux RND transporter periplasmic adaptor subunit [Anaerolineales bacterium]|nr:efflux RND transporter periplasmic adaptor subunit [Anaerolineales bacterium]